MPPRPCDHAAEVPAVLPVHVLVVPQTQFTIRVPDIPVVFHLLLISAAELGFAWDGDEKGWVRVSLPPLRMMTGLVQHFRSAILNAWRFQVFARLSERQGFFGEVSLLILQGSLQLLTYLPRPTCGNEIKCC